MMKALNILFAEDDQTLGYLVKENLEQKGHSVTIVENGEKAQNELDDKSFDLCLLDIMMPAVDGLTLSSRIRKNNQQLPIIFLTAKQQEADKIAAFKNGADDYLIKPFSLTELNLRIEAVMRRVLMRTGPEIFREQTQFTLGRLLFDYEQRTLTGFDEIKVLSSREADLLKLFCLNKNVLLNRSYILKEIWRNDDYFMARTMDVFITRLRKLIKKENNIEIKNLYGTGFKMTVKE
jgi:two-component system, OmpR family, response regulator